MKQNPIQISKRLLIIAAGAICMVYPHAARADYALVIDPTAREQTFRGWGTSLCWWANVVGKFPEPARSDYIDKVFDPKTGLGLNIVRYNIGGGENPKYLSPNLPFLTYRTNIPGYEPSQGVWDWTADAGQRYILKKAMAKGANIVQAFSNSPPYWMTVSGSVTGANGWGNNNLSPDHEQDYADYLTTVVDQFQKKWGVTFDSLEPFNEPDGGWWQFGHWQEGCSVDRPSEARITRLVGAALIGKRLKTKLAVTDENSINNTVASVNSFDAPTLAFVSQIDTHSYNGSHRKELKDAAQQSGKDLWMSEYGDGDGTGLTMSKTILRDIKDMGAEAWVYWQAVDGGGWGLLTNPEKDNTTTQYEINQKYYVLAQYSRFIHQNAVILSCDDPNSLTALDAKTKRLAIVTTNDQNEPSTVSYDLGKFGKVTTISVYQTCGSPAEELTQVQTPAIVSDKFTAVLPAKSVTTFVVTK
jgi:O-glycosyl hydrolase